MAFSLLIAERPWEKKVKEQSGLCLKSCRCLFKVNSSSSVPSGESFGADPWESLALGGPGQG